MIFDLNEAAASDVRGGYDVCIAGAGVAGITLAAELAAHGRRVLLLEAGGLEFTDDSQNVYKGRSVGRSYFELHEARLRYLGGSSNHWNGWCRPLDAWDFKSHDHIPHSGWPIAKAELDRYLDRASQILEVSPDFRDHAVADSEDALTRIAFHFSPPVRFSEKYRRTLKDSNRIDLFLNANIVDARLAEANDRMVEFQCANYADPSVRHGFAATAFVLAMGGIENPRIMLNFRRQNPNGIGNARDIVGRYFMEHIHVLGGFYAAEKNVWPFGDKEIYMAPSSEFMTTQKIANTGLRIGSLFDPGPGLGAQVKQRIFCAEDIVRDFVNNFYDLECLTKVYIGGYLRVVSEQVPNWKSRVFLSDEIDRFGLRRAMLDWRITDIDRRTIKHMMNGFGRYLAVRKYGNIKLIDWLLDDSEPVPGVGDGEWSGAGWHHMGTTRMAQTPAEGVVDENCRVFGVNNLFIAGSSVFPTVGHANPTLTIVQLTLRLAEHLKQILKA